MTIHRIIEMESGFLPALQFFPDLTPEVLAENRSWMQPAAMDKNDVLIMCFQSYVVRTPHHTILVDTCVGNDKRRSARPAWHMKTDDAYMRALAAHGLTVNDIDYVMCTHLHVDHIGWNTRLDNGRWVPTFPKARYLFAKKEYDYWAELNAKKPITVFTDSVLPVIEANRADLVSSTYQLGDHVRLLPTPGHTPDHVAVVVGRQRDEAVMTGDLMHSPLQMRHPELSAGVDYDKAQATQTRHDFFERYCDSETLCCTMHFPSPSVGRIKRWDKGYRCEMVTK
jgi:glyoxylase-like metal-dependent hydrolase (beta-lactamase superfamily II)